jgi:hypothetical protein
MRHAATEKSGDEREKRINELTKQCSKNAAERGLLVTTGSSLAVLAFSLTSSAAVSIVAAARGAS